jgi:hypothetical protein
MGIRHRQRDISARAAARALAPFLAEYRAETGIDLVDRISTDDKLLRLALAYSELSTLIDDTTGLAAKQRATHDAATTAVQGQRLSLRVNKLLYATADEIRQRLTQLAANHRDAGEPR